MNLEIVEFIRSAHFKIDLLYPNYKILSKLGQVNGSPIHVNSPLEFAQVQRDEIEEERESEGCPMILETIGRVLRQTLVVFNQYSKREKIPSRNSISQNMEKFIEGCFRNWPGSGITAECREILKEKLNGDVQVVIYALSQWHTVYTEFFQERFYEAIEQYHQIDTKINLFRLREILCGELVQFLEQTLGTAPGLTYSILLGQLREQTLQLVDTFNSIIARLFQDCQKGVEKTVELFSKYTDDCSILNKYIMVAVMQELSQRSYDIVENYQSFSIFINSSFEVRERFAKFLILNFDNIQMVSDANLQDVPMLIRNEDDIDQYLKTIIPKEVKVIIHQVMRKSDKKKGFLIETDDKLQIIIHQENDSIIFTNGKIVGNRWTYIQLVGDKQVIKTKSELQEEYSSLQQAIKAHEFQKDVSEINNNQDMAETISIASSQAQTAQVSQIQTQIERQMQTLHIQTVATVGVMTTAAGDIGSSLGYCLANINKYSSRKEFLKDFGSTAAINGSMTFLIMQMPLVGKIVAVGGFGYFTYRIYVNESASKGSKVTQFNKLLISTTTGLGSSIGGAIIGQALIPIPLLGALVGGFIGGLVGGTSTSALFDYMNDKKASEIVMKLEFAQAEDGSWNDLALIDLLGLNKSYFVHHYPDNLKFDKNRELKWLNMLVYGFLSVYYTQKEQTERLKMEKEMEKKKKKSKQVEHASITVRDLDAEEVEEQANDEEAIDKKEWPYSIEKSSKWLIQQRCLLAAALPHLVESIRNIISNM